MLSPLISTIDRTSPKSVMALSEGSSSKAGLSQGSWRTHVGIDVALHPQFRCEAAGLPQ